MNKLCLAGIFGFVLPFTAASQNRQSASNEPVNWSIQLQPRKQVCRKGRLITVQITARIKPGWHLYALDEIPNGPRPTRIWLPAAQPFALGGEIQQPVPLMKFDENFGVETQFYQGSANFLVPLKIAGTAPPGVQKLIVQMRYQTCNEHLCLPPKTVQLEAPLAIK